MPPSEDAPVAGESPGDSSASQEGDAAGPTPESFGRWKQVRFVLATALFALVSRISERVGRISDRDGQFSDRYGRISERIGRDPSVWVFGARGGTAFADNAKYLYLHVVAHHPEVRAVWLSRDHGVVDDLQDAGYDAHHVHSPRGVYFALRAGVVFLTEDFRDVNVAAVGGARVVQLWHGIPIKRIGWDAELPALPLAIRLCLGHLQRHVSQLVLTANDLTGAFASGLRVDRDAHVVADYPRIDALERAVPGETVGEDARVAARLDRAAASGPLVGYLPTYRDADGQGVAAHLDFDALERLLDEHDATLAIKPHPKEELDRDTEPGSRIVELPADADAYPLLRRTDALVTDYSSVAFDYLHVDRPLVFYPYDRERYERTRGFYVDYDAVTPGPVAEDFDAFLDALDDVLDGIAGRDDASDDASDAHGDAQDDDIGDGIGDDYREERAIVRDRLFDDADSEHAERTYRVVADADSEHAERTYRVVADADRRAREQS